MKNIHKLANNPRVRHLAGKSTPRTETRKKYKDLITELQVFS